MRKILITFGLVFVLLLSGCTKNYSDGRVYNGDINFFIQPDGQGTMTYPDGSEYVGSFNDGEITGKGVFTYSTGRVETGVFEEEKLKDGSIDILIGDQSISIEVVNFELQVDEDSNFFVVNNHEDISYALAQAMITGETVIVNSKHFDFDENTLANSEYGIIPYFDLATNYAINNYGVYNPSFTTPTIESSIDYPYIKSITVDFTLDENQLSLVNTRVEAVIKTLINAEMDDFEKVLEIHDFLVETVTYNSDLENLSDIDHTAYGALINGKAVCDGYMDAFHLLLHEAGIESYNVTGDDLNEDDNYWHAWNLVKMDGEFYHIDVTWNDNDDNRSNYTYFGLSDSEIKESHVVFPANKIPVANGQRNNYYEYHFLRGLPIRYFYTNATYYGLMNDDIEEDGYGEMYYFDGSRYYGYYENGLRTNGTYYFGDGAYFRGEFKNDDFYYGTYKFKNGDRFEGYMTSDGLGQGTYYWKNGRSETKDFSE